VYQELNIHGGEIGKFPKKSGDPLGAFPPYLQKFYWLREDEKSTRRPVCLLILCFLCPLLESLWFKNQRP
jgi:hypothetical protein